MINQHTASQYRLRCFLFFNFIMENDKIKLDKVKKSIKKARDSDENIKMARCKMVYSR